MKTASDPRHLRRRKAVSYLFRYTFEKNQEIESDLAQKIIRRIKKVDEVITQSAPEWPLEQINRIDLAILRLAVYEMALIKKEPPKVVIDEAVELAKEFGGEKSSSFINGVLGSVYDKYYEEEENNES
jgi:transcription antitermination protein NusB